MESKFCTILFSKYSPYSTQLMGILEKAPIDFAGITGLTPVCIDNDKVRQRIAKSKTINVASVPCILIARTDGSVEQYEGQRAFDWVQNIIQTNLPPVVTQPPPPVVTKPPPPVSKQPSRQTNKDSDSDSDTDSSIEYIPPPKNKKKKKKKKNADKKTPVTDVLSEDSESDDDTTLPKRPPVAIRSGAGGYDVSESDEFGDPFEQNRDLSRMTNESGSQDANTKKAGDLMAQAMAMQKERESGADSSKKPFSM